MKYVYTVEDVIKEKGSDYMEFESENLALAEIYERLREKRWTRREIVKYKPFIELMCLRYNEYGQFEEIESETVFNYTLANAVL